MFITQYLAEEHRRCDRFYADAEKAVSEGKWEEAEKAFGLFKEKTLLHFRKEEEVLFPEFESRTGITMGPTQVMRFEHQQMRELLGKLEEALKSRNREEFLSAGESLMVLLQQHNMKEEQILYPMADQHLEREEVVEKMESLGEV
ncbi:MAG: hemerythrin domain-containing protein [Aquificota bacterium]|nr:hemerythrin domain-containing protein [Aquificota bacterium]